MDKPLIGWVGLGNMGNAMVLNLLKNGYTVNVYNRTKEKETEVVNAGALSQESMQQLVHNSSIIFTMVSDDDAVKEIFESGEGLLSHAPSGKVFVDMSTVSPHTSKYLADLCINSRNEFIEAPVSGSVKPALEGSLIILAAGDSSTFKKVQTVFEVLGKKTFYLGENGSGTSAKLAINYFLAANLQALAEMVVFAKQKGIKEEDILGILNEGALASPFTKMKTANILDNNYSAAFQLKHLVKDLRLAGDEGLTTPLYPAVFESFLEAMENGLGDEDCIAVIKQLQNNTD